MKFKEAEFMPLLFGNDINVYSVARAFYERYGLKSKCYCKSLKSTCYKSKMIDLEEVKGLDTKEVFLECVNNFVAIFHSCFFPQNYCDENLRGPHVHR